MEEIAKRQTLKREWNHNSSIRNRHSFILNNSLHFATAQENFVMSNDIG